jgi:hypothetical protein
MMFYRVRSISNLKDRVAQMIRVASKMELTFEARAAWVLLGIYAAQVDAPPVCVPELLDAYGEQASRKAFRELQDHGLVYGAQTIDGPMLLISDEPRSEEEFKKTGPVI